mgnify:CR=1 FL=1
MLDFVAENSNVTRKVRWHLDEMQDPDLVPKHLTKKEFGRRVFQLMQRKGWTQSELARRADLPRDSISTYIRGKVFPSPKSLQKLANALAIAPGDLLPNAMEGAYDEDDPEMEMTLSAAKPGFAWLRVNRLLPISTASQIVQMVSEAAEQEMKKRSDGAASDAE